MIGKKVNNLYKSLRNGTIKALLMVEPLNNEKVKNQRYDICKTSCDKYNPKNDKCKLCTCFMSIKTGMLKNRNPKTLEIEITHCPRGKWGDEKIKNYYKKLKKKTNKL